MHLKLDSSEGFQRACYLLLGNTVKRRGYGDGRVERADNVALTSRMLQIEDEVAIALADCLPLPIVFAVTGLYLG
jgi:hypothetical protein